MKNFEYCQIEMVKFFICKCQTQKKNINKNDLFEIIQDLSTSMNFIRQNFKLFDKISNYLTKFDII